MRTQKMNQRGRLRRIAAALAAIATAVVPQAARAGGAALPEGIEAEVSGTAPARLLELAHRHPEQVLANRALRRLRAQDPGVHRDIVLAARCARAEIALAKAMAKADEPTLRRFACDCAARVLPLYTRFAPGVDPLRRDGVGTPATAVARGGAAPKPAPHGTTRTETFETAIREAEQEVDALEREVAAEAGIVRGARSSAGRHRLRPDRTARRAPGRRAGGTQRRRGAGAAPPHVHRRDEGGGGDRRGVAGGGRWKPAPHRRHVRGDRRSRLSRQRVPGQRARRRAGRRVSRARLAAAPPAGALD